MNTPGAENTTTPVTDPGGDTGCDAPVVTIGSVQGSGAASPAAGTTVEIEGVVTGDFQVGGFDGYYMQDFGDGDPATSDGIFVYAQGGAEVAVGDAVHVKGAVSEYFELTEITPTAVEVCATGAESPAPVELTLPIDPAAREPLEGMRVAFREPLTIIEYFEHAQYGQIVLGRAGSTSRPRRSSRAPPGGGARREERRRAHHAGRRPQPAEPRPGVAPERSAVHARQPLPRGDLVSNVIGVLDYRFAEWAIQPTQAADHVAANPRTDVPEVAGGTTVASFNVLNYFTTLGSRGADTQAEFERQQAKIVSAITEIDADIVGLIEIENDGDAVEDLVDALNAKLGTRRTPPSRPACSEPMRSRPPSSTSRPGSSRSESSPFSTRRSTRASHDAQPARARPDVRRHRDRRRRHRRREPPQVEGSAAPTIRTRATARATAATSARGRRRRSRPWLATGPTGAEPGRDLIIGDLNAYDKEDPIRALVTAGYTDLRAQFEGEDAYSYVFDGQLGYLDHALAAPGLVREVVGTAGWTINADESSLIDYDMTYKRAAQDALFAPDPFRSSDHDPVIIGLDLVPPADTTAPSSSSPPTPP